jgi:hypothetical protein
MTRFDRAIGFRSTSTKRQPANIVSKWDTELPPKQPVDFVLLDESQDKVFFNSVFPAKEG